MRLHLRRLLPIVITAFWAVAVIAGLGLLAVHGSTPGRAGHPPGAWPRSSVVKPATGCVNLVMAVHPRCPCTRASVAELARLMARSEGRVQAHVLFLAPQSKEEGWERSGLWASASEIPGVRAIADVGGAEAARFGLETSGHVLLYDANGELRFSGGITDGRGHEGDNAGLDAAIDVLSGRAGATASYPVFGCRMFSHPKP